MVIKDKFGLFAYVARPSGIQNFRILEKVVIVWIQFHISRIYFFIKHTRGTPDVTTSICKNRKTTPQKLPKKFSSKEIQDKNRKSYINSKICEGNLNNFHFIWETLKKCLSRRTSQRSFHWKHSVKRKPPWSQRRNLRSLLIMEPLNLHATDSRLKKIWKNCRKTSLKFYWTFFGHRKIGEWAILAKIFLVPTLRAAKILDGLNNGLKTYLEAEGSRNNYLPLVYAGLTVTVRAG